MAMVTLEAWTIEGTVFGVNDSNRCEGGSWGTTSTVEWKLESREKSSEAGEHRGETTEPNPRENRISGEWKREKKEKREKGKIGTKGDEWCRF
ncbi:hypothetical protein RHMOL_Rhmol06G0141100 [Rhododendron molle]|uniref:Uncharacterized protein n=1 Tax=Rhododendron molle TaxID=49168 RepID=A0ACC0NE15_RHOML|nr:hypothetical protein RHMOL_Rhmol06G0141100 [Rhododendron molle]